MRKRKKKILVNGSLIIFILATFFYMLFSEEVNKTFGLEYEDTVNTLKYDDNAIGDEVSVYFLDVGQADSILIRSNGENMLIDGGNNEDGPLLVEYFKKLNITSFKYLVGTHPHEDHIGGLDDVINNFEVGTIYLPDAITTTRTFEDLLDAMENRNMTYEVPLIDNTFKLGRVLFKVIYTGVDTKNLNNASIILKMVYGNNSFLFTGDATSTIEKKILNKDVRADVLKVGHHGSKYSSSDNFLDKVKPKYAVISVGKNNIYKHPDLKTIKALDERGIKIYRTDEEGSILAVTDGNKISFSKVVTDTNG